MKEVSKELLRQLFAQGRLLYSPAMGKLLRKSLLTDMSLCRLSQLKRNKVQLIEKNIVKF